MTATVAFSGDSAEAGVLPPGGTFLDDDGNIHEGMIEAIAADGITLGCEVVGPLYCPKADVPRDQMASFLARALKLPDSTTDWFDDDDGNTHEANINKVADAGITLGVGGRLYDPKGLVSRAQMASFLARALMLPDSTTNWFTDDEGNTHEANINKVADDGITLGCDSAGNYCPLDNVKRDQMASFLGRALGLEEMIPPPRGTSDTEAPTWPGGAALSVTGKSDVTIVVDWSANPATDNVGVASYNVYVDDVFNQPVTGTSANVVGLSPNTSYTIRVEAEDTAGNESTGGPSVMATTDAGGADAFVITVGFTFSPDSVPITTGDTVQWDNTSAGLHNVVWDGAVFPGSGAASTDMWTYQETFATAGTFTYFCVIHVGLAMTGSVIVTDP